ncbi:hypothetical protein KQI52_12885 [bacterium]|nr:hypothetical protein [bacterium]
MNIQVSEQTMADARGIARDVHSMMVASYKFDGTTCKPLPAITLRDTIAAKLVEPENLLRVQLVYPEDGPDDRWYASCEALLGGGIEHRGKRYKILGASSSLKKGNVWLATDDVREKLHPYFITSQEALAYLGILFSGCHHGIHRLEGVRGMVVDDGVHDTADGMGYVSREFLRRMGLPERQIQVRFVGDQAGAQWLGKGTLLPADLPDGRDFILPKSMVKGAGSPPEGAWTCWFGLRDIAKTRRYRSSFTYAQWFDDPTLESVWPVVEHRLEVIKGALSDRDKALRFLGLLHVDSMDPARSKAEAFLEAGIEPDHPWLQRQLRTMMRRSFVDLALGGGIELTGRMGAWTPDLPEGVICAPDLSAGPVVLSRFPIRDPHSFVPVWNEPDAVPDAPPGTVFVNDQDCQQLDGDYDGDMFTVCTQPAILEAVTSPDWYSDYRRQDVPPKKRRKDPLTSLPYVAVESIGGAIGTYSYAIAGALHSGQPEKIAPLSAALQAEVQSLKWTTRGDRALLDDPALAIPQFIADAKNDSDLFDRKAETVEGDTALVRQYNRVVRAWSDDLPATRPLVQFKHHVPIWKVPAALHHVEEAKAVVLTYNRWIASILQQMKNPSQDDLTGPIGFLEAWDQSKTVDRDAWGAALWHVVHGTRADTTGSAAFHAFTEELLALIADTANLPAPMRQTQAKPASDAEQSHTEDGEGAGQAPSTRTPGDPNVIPLVGGLKVADDDQGFRRFIYKLSDAGTVNLRTAAGNGSGPGFYAGDRFVGCVPKDHLLYGSIPDGLTFPARLQLRGRTVYAMPLDACWLTRQN